MTAYEPLAPCYDRLLESTAYESVIAQVAKLGHNAEGLRGRRLLDVACGTGNTFMPFARGTRCRHVSISPAMVAQQAKMSDAEIAMQRHKRQRARHEARPLQLRRLLTPFHRLPVVHDHVVTSSPSGRR